MLALGWVRCWLDGWVDSVFGVWLGQSCGLTTCFGLFLANFVGVWGGVCSCMVLCMCSLCVGLGFGHVLGGCMG